MCTFDCQGFIIYYIMIIPYYFIIRAYIVSSNFTHALLTLFPYISYDIGFGSFELYVVCGYRHSRNCLPLSRVCGDRFLSLEGCDLIVTCILENYALGEVRTERIFRLTSIVKTERFNMSN